MENRTLKESSDLSAKFAPFILVLLVILLPGILHAALPMGAQHPGLSPVFHPRRILIKPKAGTLTTSQLSQMQVVNGARVLHTLPRTGVQVLELPEGTDIRAGIDAYLRSGAVDYAEPDYEIHLTVTPNDPQYLNGALWALNNTGQNGGVNDADIDAPEGWNVRTQAPNVIVAVIDTGIRSTHQDLSANLWTNPAEIPGNGIDDDGDGFIDDVHGINAINHTGHPDDDHGHGTHVAGIIGAVGNNGVGVAGVAWHVQLMACKFLDSSGSGYISDAITCIDFARTHGASVMNNSWGGIGYSQALKDAIDDAAAAGIIFVAAAGNSSADNDSALFYPASYTSGNVVSVAATTRTDGLAYFSNYGQRSVDIGAPGFDILSTWNTSDSGYTTLSGTSMAAPQVSGVLAMLRAQFPGDEYHQLLNRLYSSVDPLSSLVNKCRTGGRVNLAKALGSISSQPGNDDFANRQVVSETSFSIEGINVDATKEPGEADHAGNPGGKSIWWSWSPTNNGVATITTVGTTFNTLLAVYTGSDVSTLVPVVSAATGSGSTVAFETTPGISYAIAVDGQDGASGDIVLSAILQARPANDNFANRIAITGSAATVTETNSFATIEAGEPLHAGQPGGNSVWWSWTPVVSGPATVTTFGSDFNTLLAVYTGTDVSSLTPIASNDDAPGNSPASRVDFSATAGVTYQIAVDGYQGAAGTIVLNTPPSNDNFTNRIALTGDNVTAIGFNVLASHESPEPNHAGKVGGKSVWWSWTAPVSGVASVTTVGSSFDTLLAVYSGSSLAGLSLVAANDNDPFGNSSSLLSFNAVAGTTYQIAVDGANGAAGKIMLQVVIGSQYVVAEMTPPPGYHNTGAYSMNNSGVVAGVFMTDAPNYTSHACIWTNGGQGFRQLMTNDTQSQANDINDFNQVVGSLSKPGYGSVAFIWQNGVTREIGGLDSFPFSEAYSIDNAGRVLGWSSKNGTIHGFMWQDGVMKDLGSVGTDRSYARVMNGPNYIIGWGSDVNANGQWPLVWENGVLRRLPLPEGASQGVALCVNALNQIVGHYISGPVFHSLLWQDGTMTDIGGSATYYDSSTAEWINNLGQVVGSDANYNHALLWQNGTWTALESLIPAGSGWTSLFMSYKINDRGQVVGAGLRNGFTRGYVMTPLTPVTPQAAILSPTNHQVFYESEDIPFTFWMVPDSVNVSKVDVMQGGGIVGTATNVPFPIVWRNAPAGQYTLTARTTLTSGATATSKSVAISIIPRPKIKLEGIYNSPQLLLSWPTSALDFALESATNLQPPIVWRPATNIVQVINGTNNLTVVPTNSALYYRLHKPVE